MVTAGRKVACDLWGQLWGQLGKAVRQNSICFVVFLQHFGRPSATRNSNTRQRTTLKSVVRCLVDGFPISSPGCDGTLASAVFSARSPGAASQPCDTGAAPVGVPFSMTCRRTGRLRRSFRYAARGPRRPPRFRPTRGGGAIKPTPAPSLCAGAGGEYCTAGTGGGDTIPSVPPSTAACFVPPGQGSAWYRALLGP